MRKLKIALMLTVGVLSSMTYAQKSKIMTKTETVRTFLNGFNDTAAIQQSMELLADDYKFSNPMVELNSKSDFIELAQQIGQVLTGVEVLEVAENGDWVAALYIFKSEMPGLEQNIATEWFKIEKGKIVASKLIYDATKWRALYENSEN
ncbi:nuclear transport factor 2 family protein [Flagellimonas lutimaris]|uniref:Nuclear transport factor 2 family protein n=1 Tax=Flagellimonas lutimaris TaxID=475082 RepID=A0A3A1NAX6_9FLAO|nr:nuclear transport factor 2 family protein [Allomuricauda lutimaris]RIV36717.1 nuclear transport factor 2 family protein [Allomuricauda lutimaris]